MLGKLGAVDELDQSKENMTRVCSLRKLHAAKPRLALSTEAAPGGDVADTGAEARARCDVLDSQEAAG